MPDYADLQQRLDNGDVIILDGAIGTELQRMGAPMDYYCWAALANETHPASVRQLHEDYIRAGVDVITTNTYMAARHVIQHGGFEDRTGDWNKRSVELALEARERTPADRPVYVAGSVSVIWPTAPSSRPQMWKIAASSRSAFSSRPAWTCCCWRCWPRV